LSKLKDESRGGTGNRSEWEWPTRLGGLACYRKNRTWRFLTNQTENIINIIKILTMTGGGGDLRRPSSTGGRCRGRLFAV